MDLTLSKLQQRAVWDGWLSAEIRANYFADLCHRYQSRQRTATVLTLIAASGAFVALLGEWLPPNLMWVRTLSAAAATALSLWSLVAQNHKRATDCSDLHARWSRLANQYRSLWDDMYAEDARRRLEALLEQETELGKSSSTFPNKTRLMQKWQTHVQLHHATHPT